MSQNSASNLSSEKASGIATSHDHMEYGDVKVWPVPFDNTLHIQIPEDLATEATFAYVVIYDMVGNVVEEETNFAGSSLKLDSSKWNPGLYIYTVSADNGFSKSGRIVKR